MSRTALRGDDFLEMMAASSARRVAAARGRESEATLRARARSTPSAPPLRLERGGFDLIAEFKRRAPFFTKTNEIVSRSTRPFSPYPPPLGPAAAAAQARRYAEGGAAAISVLTEPGIFDGHLADLEAVAAAVGVPAMRKDFLVDPYQVFEARAAGAGGVLLIARLLEPARLREMIDAAAESRLFVLLELFGTRDLRRCALGVEAARRRRVRLLLGVNHRDLKNLTILAVRTALQDPLPRRLPPRAPKVAESGVSSAENIRLKVHFGYRLALVGRALMCADDPAALCREMIDAGRDAIREGAPHPDLCICFPLSPSRKGRR